MTDSKDTPKKKTLIQGYWWIVFFFLLPFLTVGGFWGIGWWGKTIDDAGRDNIEIGALSQEAVSAFLKALFEHGIPAGLIGLAVGIILILITRLTGKLIKTKSIENDPE